MCLSFKQVLARFSKCAPQMIGQISLIQIGLQDFQPSHLHSTELNMDQPQRDKPLKTAFGSSEKPWAFKGILFNFRSNFNAIETFILRFGDLWGYNTDLILSRGRKEGKWSTLLYSNRTHQTTKQMGVSACTPLPQPQKLVSLLHNHPSIL